MRCFLTSILIYDAAISLHELSQHLTGPGLSEGSMVSELMRVIDVIKRMTPLYDADVDWEESMVRKVLDGEESAEERAKKLLA